jgi:hypothetical protein
MTPIRPLVAVALLASAARADAQGWLPPGAPGWLPWLVIGAIALLVVGIGVRMILSARFPKGYRQWARSQRDEFEARNDEWDRADEQFKR